MKAKAANLKMIGVLLAIFIGFINWEVASADYHNGYDCIDCHAMHGGTSNLKLVAEEIPPGSGKTVVFTDRPEDFADGDGTYNGVCEVCHTQTRHHLNDGSDETEHFEGQDCTSCHSHCNEFSAPGAQSHDTHLTFDKGPKIDCTDCHNPSDYSLFVDDNPLDTTNACDACHSPDGVNDPDIGAKANWVDAIYEEDGVTLKAGKEQWCATCHDDDAARSTSSSYVAPIVLDNDEASYNGTWPSYSNVDAYDGECQYHAAGSGANTARWTPNIIQAGYYKVYAWWHAHANRVTDAEYTIAFDGGPDTIDVNQEINGSQWNYLGTYLFAAGSSGYVELSDNSDAPANQYCIADAVQFEYVDPDQIIMDNLEATYVGTWPLFSGAQAYGGKAQYHAAGSGANTATWTAPPILDGQYNVYAWWQTHSNRVTDAEYIITHSSGTDTVYKSQEINGGQWNLLGTYSFVSGTPGSVQLSDKTSGPADQYVIADAVKFERADSAAGIFAPNVIGDNTTYGFYVTGHNINCLSCHDASKDHIDHTHRTYSSASDNYQAGYRLKSVDGRKAMNIPRVTTRRNPITNWTDFVLCFDCHNRDEVLSTQTNFRGAINGHFAHLNMDRGDFDSDFDGVGDSNYSCVSCHNIHGSPSPAMVRHGELIDKVPAVNFGYVTSASDPDIDPNATLMDSIAGYMNRNLKNRNLNGACVACHLQWRYYRDPFLGPKVLEPKAEPDIIPQGQDTEVILSAFVLDHNDTFTSVTVNLSEIDLGTVAMYDDGDIDNHGDEVNGDGIFSCKATVYSTVASGDKTLTVTATDSDGNGTNDIILEGIDAALIIMNNNEANYVGTWPSYGNSQAYEGDAQYHAAGNGTNTARWTPTILQSAYYKVSVWWHAHANRVTDAEYTIAYDGGTDTVDVSQEISGGQWVPLGTYLFAADSSGYVELSDNSDDPTADQYVIADAVKFERVDDTSVFIMDNTEARYVGTWTPYYGVQAYGKHAQYHAAGSGANWATWTAPPILDGQYKVYAWWHASTSRITDAEYSITHSAGTDQVYKNQEINGGKWNELGTYTLVSGTSGSVQLSDNSSNPADQYLIADAIKWELQ